LTAKINNINQGGELEIVFNHEMSIPGNLSLINNSTVGIYIIPEELRTTDDDYDPNGMNFTWNVTSFESKTLKLKLDFENPF
jgi:hypothetical protein